MQGNKMLKWGGGRRGWDGGKEKEEGVLLFPPFHPSIRVQGGWVVLSPLWIGGASSLSFEGFVSRRPEAVSRLLLPSKLPRRRRRRDCMMAKSWFRF